MSTRSAPRSKRAGIARAALARTGEALAATSLHEPDIVLLDLGLPDIDGVEVCRRLRRGFATPSSCSPPTARGGRSPHSRRVRTTTSRSRSRCRSSWPACAVAARHRDPLAAVVDRRGHRHRRPPRRHCRHEPCRRHAAATSPARSSRCSRCSPATAAGCSPGSSLVSQVWGEQRPRQGRDAALPRQPAPAQSSKWVPNGPAS